MTLREPGRIRLILETAWPSGRAEPAFLVAAMIARQDRTLKQRTGATILDDLEA
jgi:hypothetical protein